jgi:hypothetical protein
VINLYPPPVVLVKSTVSNSSTPLRSTHLQPVDCASSDQLGSNGHGKLAVMKGCPSEDFCHAGTFLIDYASNKAHVTCISLPVQMRLLLPSTVLNGWLLNIEF